MSRAAPAKPTCVSANILSRLSVLGEWAASGLKREVQYPYRVILPRRSMHTVRHCSPRGDVSHTGSTVSRCGHRQGRCGGGHRCQHIRAIHRALPPLFSPLGTSHRVRARSMWAARRRRRHDDDSNNNNNDRRPTLDVAAMFQNYHRPPRSTRVFRVIRIVRTSGESRGQTINARATSSHRHH